MIRGDKVNYIKVTKKGKGFSMSSKSGVFQDEVSDGIAEIKSSNGRMVKIKMSLVTPISEKNALTKALTGGIIWKNYYYYCRLHY